MSIVHRFVALAACVCLLAPLAVLGAGLPVASAKQTLINGEIVRQDTTWTAAGSPYIIRRPVQIPHGITLTVEPGVKIIGQGAEHLFLVAGNLKIQGRPGRLVDIQAGRKGSVIENATAYQRPGSVLISYARISNSSSIFPPSGNGVYMQFILADSVIRDVRRYSYIWYPMQGSAIVRNSFRSSGGFSIGTDARGPNDEPLAAPLRIEGNRFLTRSTTRYWIENWAAYGPPLPIHGNSFLAAGAPSVRVPAGYDSTAIDARRNFWGTTDPRIIDRMILDGLDDIRRASVIEFEPFLVIAPQGPPASTPGSPQAVTAASAGADSVRVSWTTPSDRGGRGALNYVVTASPGPGTCETRSSTWCTVSDLPSGTHTFTVTAANAAGTSVSSEPSTPVTVGGDDPGPPPGDSLAGVSLGPISMQTRGRWVAPDGCGNYLFDFRGVRPDDIGTFGLVDVDSGTRLDADLSFGELGSGTGTFTVCDFEATSQTRLALELDFSGLGTARSATFEWETNPAPLPTPVSLPFSVSLGPISVATTGPWPALTSGCATYLFTYSGVSTDDIGSIRLIDGVRRTVLDSDVFLGRVGNGTGSFVVCSYQANSATRLVLQADFSDYGVAESRNATWQAGAQPTPAVAALPALAIVGTSAVSTSGSWIAPASCRDFTYDYYGMPADAIASVRVVNATTRKILGSDVLIDPQANGTGTILMCPSDAPSGTVARLQFDLSGVGLVESDAFRFGS